MRSLHDPACRESIRSRIQRLTPAAVRQWGKMSPAEMLWHVNVGLSITLGQLTPAPEKVPIPRWIIKFMVLNLPWPKGARTSPVFLPSGTHDFDAERARCLDLVDQVAARPLAGLGQEHFVFGPMTGPEVSRLQAKHLDHHLRQFGV